MANKINVLIIGAGKGGSELIKILHKSSLTGIVGVADSNLNAPGIKLARKLGIAVSADYKEFLNDRLLEEIIDVTGSKELKEELLKVKPAGVEVIGGVSARFMWGLIDEHNQIEEELLNQYEFVEGLINTAQVIILVLDLEGKIITFNPYMEQLSGYKAHEVQGADWFDTFVPERDRSFVRQSLMSVEEEFQRKGVINPLLTKDGDEVHIEWYDKTLTQANGEVIGFVSIGHNISDRMKAYKTTRDIISYAPFGIYLVSEKGNIDYVNPAMIEISGDTYEQFKSINVFGLPSYKNLGLSGKIKDALKNNSYFSVENLHYTAQFSKKKTIRNIIGVPLEEEGEKKVLVFVEDVTERKQLEQEVVDAQKIESIGILAGGIAHDFNNFLAAIISAISVAKMELREKMEVFDILQDAEKAAFRAKGLTQQLLTFSKGGAPVKRTASIKTVIKDTVSFIMSGSKSKCRFKLSGDLWSVDIDIGQISQVIQNLVINADHSMPEGGLIKIEALNIKNGREESVLLKKKRYIKVSVTDSGIGIKEEHLRKIFDPYFSTKQKGSGLGLSTTYSIIKNHDGLITVDSQIGKGSVFNVYIPASAGVRTGLDIDRGKVIKGSGKILLMDDEDDIKKISSRLLKLLGYTVEVVSDGAQAVKSYKKAMKSGVPFDIVIIDLTIPGGMGGKEAIKQLLKIDPGVKAIVSSGYSTDPVMANYADYGFKGVVAKPYNAEQMSYALHEILNPNSKNKDR